MLQKCHSLSKNNKGFSKLIKEKIFLMSFQLLPLKISFKAKSAVEAAFLGSLRFFRHQYQWHSIIYVAMATMAIWPLWPYYVYGHSCHNRHSWSWPLIWVSKEASGPKDWSFWSWFCRINDFEGQNIKSNSEIFFLYKFWKSFVFLVNKQRFWGSTSHDPSALKFMFLESVGTIEWDPPGC